MYPIFMNMRKRKCIVIGAGNVAQRRILKLLECGADITVISPETIPLSLENKNLKYIQKCYSKKFLISNSMVFASTNNMKLNEEIIQDAHSIGAIACSATSSKRIESDFYVPASKTIGDVTISAYTNGTSPELGVTICRDIENHISDYSEICEIQKKIRIQLKEKISNINERKTILSKLNDSDMIQLYKKSGKWAYWERALKICDNIIPEKKTAILIISFGTSYENTREKTIGAVERAINKEFRDADIFRAFTSNIIINKMKKNGIYIDTVCEALERIYKIGYTHVYCQPTHIIGGEEYDKLCSDILKFNNHFVLLKIGKPLLYNTSNFSKLIEALKGVIEFSEDTAYVLMGHGTEHTANMAYPAFDYWLKQSGYPNVFVGTVEGYPTLDTVISQLDRKSYSNVILIPMMLVAGDHVQNDMAGENDNSWKSILIKHGYNVITKLNGLGEYEQLHSLYIQHIYEMIEEK